MVLPESRATPPCPSEDFEEATRYIRKWVNHQGVSMTGLTAELRYWAWWAEKDGVPSLPSRTQCAQVVFDASYVEPHPTEPMALDYAIVDALVAAGFLRVSGADSLPKSEV